MTKQAPWVALAITVLLLAACERGNEPAKQSTGTATSEQETTAGKPTGSGGEKQLTEAEEKLITELGALQTKVDKLQQQAANKTAETQAGLVKQLDALQRKREDLKQKVDELSETGTAAAANVLKGLNDSLAILTRSVEMAPEEEMNAPETAAPPAVQNP